MGSDRPVAEAAVDDRPAEDRSAAEVQVIEALPEPWWSARRRAARDPVMATARLGHVASLVVAAPLILWFNRNQWFFGDEWEFFANRMSGWGRVLLEPHNEHWSTAPILAYRAVYAAFGLRSYLPYVAVLVVLHLAAAHFLWRVMNRVGVAPLVSTGLAAVFAVLGSGYENLLWAFQIGFVGSVAVGLGHLLLVDHAGPFGRRDRLAWVVAVVGLLFSGISVVMTVTSGVAVLLRRGVRDALATVAPPAGVYVLWFAAVGHEGLRSGAGRVESVLDAPTYLWTGLCSALEGASGIPAAGAVLVVLVLGWLLRQRPVTGVPSAPATAMAIGAAALFAMLAVGRSGYGVEQGTTSRYLYIAVALLLPSIGLILSDATGRVPSRQAAALIVLAPVLLHNVAIFRDLSHAEADRERAIRTTILAAAELADDGAALPTTQPEPRFSPDISVDLLRRLVRQGALPDDELAEVDVLTAAGQLQVALTPEPPSATGAPPTVSTATNDRGCLVLGPAGASPVDVHFASPGAIALRTPTGGDVTVALHSASRPGVTGTPRTMTLRQGAVEWLHVAAPTTITLASPAPAATEVCGVRTG